MMVSHDRAIQNEKTQRFEIENADGVAELTYRLGNHHITLVHTEVARALEGKGYGGILVRAALEFARAEKLRVVPLCPFVRAYITRHPEYADLVGEEMKQT
jgi:predicted GNAT family acetyltransferase